MEELNHEISGCVENHKSGITSNEKKLIKNIQEGSKICINELGKIADNENLKRLQTTFHTNISILDNEISMIKQKIERYEELTMAEKLENPSFSKDEVKEIPSLALVTGIIEKIKVYT